MSTCRRISIASSAAGIAAAAALLAGPVASAVADTHYAAPFRLGVSFGAAPCTDPARPCPIVTALGQATANDSVQLARGDYWKSSLFVIGGGGPEAYDEPILVPDRVTLHGTDPANLPVIHVAPKTQAAAGVDLGVSAKIRDVAIDGRARDNNPISYSLFVGTNGLAERVRVRTFGAPGAFQLSCSIGSGATIRSSLCLGRGADTDGSITALGTGSGTASYSVRNVTAISLAKDGTGMSFGASGDITNGGAVATAAISNSILRGTKTDLRVRAGSDALRATANVDHTNWVTQEVTVTNQARPGASATLVPLGGNQNGPTATEPRYRDAAANDFRPLPGSPTIDAGAIDPTNNGLLALDGLNRWIGTATDLGAHEFDPASVPTPTPVPTPAPADPTPTPSPEPTIPATPGPGAGAQPGTPQAAMVDRTPPVLAKLSAAKTVTRRKGATITFTLSEPATVVLAFGQPKAGRTAGAKCVKQTTKNRKAKRCTIANVKGTLTVDGQAGANRIPFNGTVAAKKRLAFGGYTLVAAPTDAAGNRGAAPARKLTLKR